MTRSKIVLSPRPEVGVLDGIALGEGSSHEVLGRAMDTDFRRHAANYANLVRHLGGFGQILGDLIIRFGADCFPRSFTRTGLGVKGIDMAHTSFDLQENDSLGFAESVCAFCRLIAFQVRQNGQTEGAIGALFDESSSFEMEIRHNLKGVGSVTEQKEIRLN